MLRLSLLSFTDNTSKIKQNHRDTKLIINTNWRECKERRVPNILQWRTEVRHLITKKQQSEEWESKTKGMTNKGEQLNRDLCLYHSLETETPWYTTTHTCQEYEYSTTLRDVFWTARILKMVLLCRVSNIHKVSGVSFPSQELRPPRVEVNKRFSLTCTNEVYIYTSTHMHSIASYVFIDFSSYTKHSRVIISSIPMRNIFPA